MNEDNCEESKEQTQEIQFEVKPAKLNDDDWEGH